MKRSMVAPTDVAMNAAAAVWENGISPALFPLAGARCQQSPWIFAVLADPQSGAWSSWSALPGLGEGCLRSGFVDMQNSDGRFELMAAGSDENIYRIAKGADGQWGKTWQAISGSNAPSLTHPALVAGNTNDGRLQVFATDENGRVYSNWQQTPGGKWQSRWSRLGNLEGLAFDR